MLSRVALGWIDSVDRSATEVPDRGAFSSFRSTTEVPDGGAFSSVRIEDFSVDFGSDGGAFSTFRVPPRLV